MLQRRLFDGERICPETIWGSIGEESTPSFPGSFIQVVFSWSPKVHLSALGAFILRYKSVFSLNQHVV